MFQTTGLASKTWIPSFAFSGRKLKPATVTQCGEGSASRGQSPDPSASRFSRIQERLEVTLCITDGAPALLQWLTIVMVIVFVLFSWMGIEVILVFW